jgi:hypothetical protein
VSQGFRTICAAWPGGEPNNAFRDKVRKRAVFPAQNEREDSSQACILAVTLWLNRRLPSAGPKSDGLFCKLSFLFACLCRCDASRAPSSCICAAQPHTHQWILLRPRVCHSLIPFEQCWTSCSLANYGDRAGFWSPTLFSLLDLALNILLVALVAGLLLWLVL